MRTLATIEIRQFFNHSHEQQENMRISIIDNFDTKMVGHDEPEEWVDDILQSEGIWAITVNKKFAGLFALRQLRIVSPYLQSSTFILPEYRGKEVNTILKRAVAQAGVAINLPLCAYIMPDNQRSIRAMKKAFPTINPELRTVPARAGLTDQRLYYDFTKINFAVPPESGLDIYNEIHSWYASKQLAKIL